MAKEKTFESIDSAAVMDEYVIFNCERLNVRMEPKKDSAILFTLTAGTRLLCMEEVGEWMKVATKDRKPKTGYVMRRFVKEI